MPLRWELGGIRDWEDVCFIDAPQDVPDQGVKKGDRLLNPVTNTLILATVAVGMGEITEKNAAEFYARFNMIEKHDGPYLIRAVDPKTGERPKGAAARITPEEVQAHIGLATNVAFETRTKWLKRFSNDLDRAVDRYERATKQEVAT